MEALRARITLIRPPVVELPSNLSHFGAIPPIGLAYVAAVLRDSGHEVEVIDAPGLAISRFHEMGSPMGPLSLQGLSLDEIVERVSPAARVIGITHMFLHEWPLLRDLTAKLKAKFPSAMIVLGGENATCFWEHILRDSPDVDLCVLGEGEFTMRELVGRILEGKDPTSVPGVVSRSALADGTLERAPRSLSSPRVKDLSEIPWPAWELFPMDAYFREQDPFGVHRGRAMPVLATRGCPYQCTFCSSPTMWGTRYGTRQPEDVLREIRHYIDQYGVENFNFADLTAIVKKEWIMEFCGLLKRDGPKIIWQLPVGTRSEALDGEVLHALFETGCRNIVYAPENGSKRLLKVLKKRVDLSVMLKSMRASYLVGLNSSVNIIIGHPEERLPDLWHTAVFIVKCALVGCRDVAVMIFGPYPGSEDTRTLAKAGQITFDEAYHYQSLARSGKSGACYSAILSAGQLVALQFALLLLFYASAYLLRPWRFLQIARGLFTGHEESHLDKFLRAKVERARRVVVREGQA